MSLHSVVMETIVQNIYQAASSSSSSSSLSYRPFFPDYRGWTGPMNVLPPLCTILCHLWLQIQLLHVVFNTFLPCLSWPSPATFPFHLNIVKVVTFLLRV